MIDDTAPAIDQPETVAANGHRAFSCEWNGERLTKTFSQWAYVTHIHRNTIKTRFYNGRSARECLGLDKITPRTGAARPRESVLAKERRQVDAAQQFLLMRW